MTFSRIAPLLVALSAVTPPGTLASAPAGPSSRPAESRPATSRPETSPPATSRPGEASARSRVETAVRAHGGLDAWRRLRRGRFALDMTRMDTAGRPAGPASRVVVSFPTSGEARVDAEMGGLRMSYEDGKTEVRDTAGRPMDDTAAHRQARFSLPTLQYILSLPWKLLDVGSRYEAIPDRMAGGRRLSGVGVTYAPGTGDSPRDWYRYYFDPATGRLVEVLWIITSADYPHPGHIEWCRFEDLRPAGGVLLPHRWTFVSANEDGDEIGPTAMEIRLVEAEFGDDALPATVPSAPPRPASRPAY